jgi:uncharacterized protein with HEPN domain
MREKLRDKGRIEDIIKYSENIRTMIDGVSYETFQNNILIYYAVMKNVEIVGEAAYMLSAEFKESHQDFDELLIERNRYGAIWLHFAVRSSGNRRKVAFIQA